MKRLLAACLLMLTAVAAGAAEQPIAVAAASDLKFALESVIKEFQRTHRGIEVRPSFGSSGNFYAQLSNGAPFDLFFSADVEYPRRLLEQGVALAGSDFLYAIGRIVVFVPRSSTLDLVALGLKAVAQESVRKVSIANPEHAPYGRAAVAALKSSGLYESVEKKLVFGENVSQAAQFVESGAADAGIIALSLAVAPAMKDAGRFWEVPLNAYPSLEQVGVIIKNTKNPKAAGAFRAFVVGTEGRAILKRYGFEVPVP